MILRPASRDELAQSLRAAGAGTRIAEIDLTRLNHVLEHMPEDMTVTVEAGMTLAELQTTLALHRQWVPIDPPHPERLTIRDVLDQNASGPRRMAHGTIRDHLIGLRVALADGRIIHSGGKVVKNVAGYDLTKLFIGAQGSLGVVVEAAFKLLPLPETERIVQARCGSLEEAEQLIAAVRQSGVNPTVLDLHQFATDGTQHEIHLVVGFAGNSEEVAWQLEQLTPLGLVQPATLDYDAEFHAADAPPCHRISVLPSKVIETVKELGEVPFVARAGNGLIYYRGGPTRPKPALPVALLERVKATFDPRRIFPEPSW
jgi:FAD/FMN-containing dehydrogenase